MRLGLFGGSFDPVHHGHLLLAECCREQCNLDEVWFIPTAVPPHKPGRELTSAEARAEMLELAVAGHQQFIVSRYEVDRGGVNYTVNTLEHFHREIPNSEFFFLMGADMLNDLPSWREAPRLCELALPVVVRRPGAGELDFDSLAGIASAERIDEIRRHQVDMPQMDLSSTTIRQRVADGLSIRYRVPRALEKYIQTHRLYT